jgi:hypothetical protein
VFAACKEEHAPCSLRSMILGHTVMSTMRRAYTSRIGYTRLPGLGGIAELVNTPGPGDLAEPEDVAVQAFVQFCRLEVSHHVLGEVVVVSERVLHIAALSPPVLVYQRAE